jgi:hypothetical protein
MGFPIPSMNPVRYASFASITVTYVSGFNPNNDQACGRFNGNTITIYEKARASNKVLYCEDFGYSSLIAHELGHFYGLSDIYDTTCTSIMGQADGLTHYVTGQDCGAARDSKTTPSENLPVDYGCNEPCAGSCTSDGYCEATTTPTSPIVIALQGNRFSLSGLEDPVLFDIMNDGTPIWMSWTAGGGGTAFLTLDRNGNGTIDNGSELFGNQTVLPDGCMAVNGYVALAPYDSEALGGNGNLEIDPGDAIYPMLRLWLDEDHDGVSDSGELMPLAEAGITAIGLDYHLDHRTDRFGNHFWLRGSAWRLGPSGQVEHPLVIYDVYFVRE